MAQMSDYLENALINHVFRNTAMTSPTTIYLALYTSSPTDADSGTEVSAASYVRQAITLGAPSNGVATNDSDIIFPKATESWGTITSVGIRDADTGGNLLMYGDLDSSATIDTNDQFVLSAGDLSVTFD